MCSQHTHKKSPSPILFVRALCKRNKRRLRNRRSRLDRNTELIIAFWSVPNLQRLAAEPPPLVRVVQGYANECCECLSQNSAFEAIDRHSPLTNGTLSAVGCASIPVDVVSYNIDGVTTTTTLNGCLDLCLHDVRNVGTEA